MARIDKWRDWPTDIDQWHREVENYEAKYRPLVQNLARPTELAALSNVVAEAIRDLNEELKAASTETMRERGPNLAGRSLGNQRRY